MVLGTYSKTYIKPEEIMKKYKISFHHLEPKISESSKIKAKRNVKIVIPKDNDKFYFN